MDKLRRCDIYAGVGEAEKEYDFNTAYQMVMESFESFTPKFKELANRVFEEGHVDS